MRTICLSLAAAALTLLSVQARQLGRDEHLEFFFSPPEGYSQPYYGREPTSGSNYIYFAGDAVPIAVEIANASSRALTVSTSGVPVDAGVLVRLLPDGETTTAPPSATLRLIPDGTVDERTRGTATSWGVDVVLEPKWAVRYEGHLELDAPLLPGQYIVELRGLGLRCEPGCSIQRVAGKFRFEIKSASNRAERVDRHLMRALRSLALREYEQADREISDALSIYPAASGAYRVLGMKADALREWGDAAKAYQRAVELLERGEDRLLPATEGNPLPSLRNQAERARRLATGK